MPLPIEMGCGVTVGGQVTWRGAQPLALDSIYQFDPQAFWKKGAGGLRSYTGSSEYVGGTPIVVKRSGDSEELPVEQASYWRVNPFGSGAGVWGWMGKPKMDPSMAIQPYPL